MRLAYMILSAFVIVYSLTYAWWLKNHQNLMGSIAIAVLSVLTAFLVVYHLRTS